ncbi:RING finger protein [Trichinella nelsoni]|uniref:RING finger protein n=1 Tax=Trichinella nelsoni TaxID=6336 RepID=A0A0V0S2L0_9BILA|nr:RING finger protein [Trichinella nelsoni]
MDNNNGKGIFQEKTDFAQFAEDLISACEKVVDSEAIDVLQEMVEKEMHTIIQKCAVVMLKAGSHVLTIDNCQKAMDILGRPVVFYNEWSNEAEAETDQTSSSGHRDSKLISLFSLALQPLESSSVCSDDEQVEFVSWSTKNTFSRSSVGGCEYSQMPNYAASVTVARPVTDFLKKENFLICAHVVKNIAREAKMLGKVRKYFQSWDMTFEQFERQVNMLNFRQVHSSNELCRRLIDSNGNYVKFTVLTNDFVFNDMLFWKLLVKVRCDMVKLDEREPEKSVVVSFIRFLGICDFVNDFLSKPVVKAGQDKVGSSVYQNDVETCCLCLDNVEDIVLRCGHSFCSPCMYQWTECSSGKCPLCLDRCSSKACQWYVMTDIPTHTEFADYFAYIFN